MSAFLTLLVACCVARGVSPAATPLLFTLRHDDHGLRFDAPPSAPIHEPFRQSSSLFFSGNVPEQPAAAGLSHAVGRTSGHRIVFEEPAGDDGNRDPGVSTPSSDAASPAVIYPNPVNRHNTPVQPIGGCGLSTNLTVFYNGVPWQLLAQGHCPDGEWAVMRPDCQPECRPRPCNETQLQYQGQCVNLSDSTVCPKEQILYLDEQGSTFCDCEENSFYYPWKGQCYARREQGPCDFGSFLDINQNGHVDCMPKECEADGYEKDPSTGRCYRKDFVGYCPPLSLQFHHNNHTAGCLSLDIRNLFDRSITRYCEAGSRIDHLGQCRQQIVVPSITSLPRSLTQGCRSGAINVGSGPCRRVNGYFQ